MNDTIIHDSIKVASKVITKVTETDDRTNWWMWLATFELGIIVYLILKNKLKSKIAKKKQFRSEALRQDIDFNNIINSSFNSLKLYDELKTRCHPDRFPTDEEKNLIAENLFQEISKNKMNIKRLLELKEEAIQKLKIDF
ncbi:MAG: molecular chaperone DnaJ [Sphingobacteriia bacterium]|nr:molecular chaperone DnaJ [Sphingobacteriia bacterium]